MKKSFMTRALATGLSLAMAFSLTAATNVTTAAAAAKPAMKASKMTVKEGKSKTFLATAKTLKTYKITKAKVKNASAKQYISVKKNAKGTGIVVTGKKGADTARKIVITFQNKKTKKTTNLTTKVVVKAVTPVTPVDETTKISAAKQNTFTEFTVTMSKALETVAAADFSMVRDDDNQVITVKSATLDAKDKTQVKLVVYTSLTDAKTYTITYTAADEAKTQSSTQVTVTDGTVADVAITPLEITANSATLIEYQTLDANGVIVSQKGASKAESKVDVTWDSLLGTMDNDTSKYILYNEGDTAKFTVTYHTYKYDTTTGAELGVITKDFTVTAVKDASVISQFAYTAATNKPYDWSKVTPKQTIALGDDGSNSKQRTAYFLIKDAKGNNVTDTCGYTVESSDNSIVVADGTVKDGAVLSPVNKGTAYLMIKDADGKVVNTLPITVGEKRTVSTFKLSSAVVNVVSTAAFAAGNKNNAACVYTDVTAKDQYGDDIAVSLEYENKTNNGVATLDLNAPAANSIRVTGTTSGKKGYDNYIIKATDALNKSMTTSLRVNSIEPTGTVTYSVVFLDENEKVVSSVDTTIGENLAAAPAAKTLKAVVVEKQSGVVVKACDATTNIGISGVKVTKNDGTTVANAVSKAGVTITSSAAIDASIMGAGVTNAAINAAKDVVVTVRSFTNPNSVKNLGVGTYTIVYDLTKANNKTDRASASFAVKDTQTAVTAKVKETACGNATSINSILADPNFIEYYYGDVKLDTMPAVVDAKVTYSATTNGGYKNAYVKNVTITVPVAGQTYTMNVEVPVNKTFTTTNAWS